MEKLIKKFLKTYKGKYVITGGQNFKLLTKKFSIFWA